MGYFYKKSRGRGCQMPDASQKRETTIHQRHNNGKGRNHHEEKKREQPLLVKKEERRIVIHFSTMNFLNSEQVNQQAEEEENDDRGQYAIRKGDWADLSALRNEETVEIALEQRGASKENDTLLASCIECRATCTGELYGFSNVAGNVYITDAQVLFVALDGSSSEHDMAIGATCIQLHALTEEPELAVYLQLGQDEDTTELTLTPLEQNDGDIIFKALCKLVSLHPIMDDDDDENQQGDEEFGDDLIWAPSSTTGPRVATAFPDDDENLEEGGATEAARAAMLLRLDEMLVVAPEYENQEGQFDDAAEDEEDNNLL
jgi:hypothetical protein